MRIGRRRAIQQGIAEVRIPPAACGPERTYKTILAVFDLRHHESTHTISREINPLPSFWFRAFPPVTPLLLFLFPLPLSRAPLRRTPRDREEADAAGEAIGHRHRLHHHRPRAGSGGARDSRGVDLWATRAVWICGGQGGFEWRRVWGCREADSRGALWELVWGERSVRERNAAGAAEEGGFPGFRRSLAPLPPSCFSV